MIRTILSAIPFVLAPLAAQAQSGGKWEVKVAPSECALIRNVPGEAPELLAVRTMAGTDEYVVLVSGKDVPERGKDKDFPAKLVFDDAKPMEVTAIPAGRLSSGPAVQFFGLGPAMLDAFVAAHSVGVVRGSDSLARFDLPHAREAVAALTRCVDDQLVEWGADPAQFAPGGTPPVPLRQRDDWLSNKQLLKLADESGSTGIDYLFRVTIATDGTVESCKRDTAEANDKAEKLGCAPLIGQKLFTPAKNPAGVPVKGVLASHVMLVTRVTTETTVTR